MLPTVIYLLAALRRALRKSGRGLFMIAEVFGEALEQSHAVRGGSIRSRITRRGPNRSGDQARLE